MSSPAVFDAMLRGHNPELLHADHDAQGCASATVTADRFVDAHHGARRQRRARD